MSFPANEPIKTYEPFRMVISDSYGVEVVLSRTYPHVGDVLNMKVSDWDNDGEPGLIKVAGFFHDRFRQNRIEDLRRLRSMQYLSPKVPQLLMLSCPFPDITIRGYIPSFQGPDYDTTRPLFFDFAFDFVRSVKARQQQMYRPSDEINMERGKPYLMVTVEADTTSLRDLLDLHYENDARDAIRHYKAALELNGFNPEGARHMPVGLEVKIPRR